MNSKPSPFVVNLLRVVFGFTAGLLWVLGIGYGLDLLNQPADSAIILGMLIIAIGTVLFGSFVLYICPVLRRTLNNILLSFRD
jgi:hypothetical protein